MQIVDIGGSHGHLSRKLALVNSSAPMVYVDLNPALLERAQPLQSRTTTFTRGIVSYLHANVVTSLSLLQGDDLLFGLHPCGSLGDRNLQLAGEHGASDARVMLFAEVVGRGPRGRGADAAFCDCSWKRGCKECAECRSEAAWGYE
jgi:hypothetical protein